MHASILLSRTMLSCRGQHPHSSHWIVTWKGSRETRTLSLNPVTLDPIHSLTGTLHLGLFCIWQTVELIPNSYWVETGMFIWKMIWFIWKMIWFRDSLLWSTVLGLLHGQGRAESSFHWKSILWTFSRITTVHWVYLFLFLVLFLMKNTPIYESLAGLGFWAGILLPLPPPRSFCAWKKKTSVLFHAMKNVRNHLNSLYYETTTGSQQFWSW